MHEQYPAAVPALSPVMPSSSIPRRRSSRLSSASDPHTPPPRDTPLPMLSPASNRKGSDSWNSSNYDPADDFEWEWKPEQTRLLSRVSLQLRVSKRDTPCSQSWRVLVPVGCLSSRPWSDLLS